VACHVAHHDGLCKTIASSRFRPAAALAGSEQTGAIQFLPPTSLMRRRLNGANIAVIFFLAPQMAAVSLWGAIGVGACQPLLISVLFRVANLAVSLPSIFCWFRMAQHGGASICFQPLCTKTA
jgi:hypothetical protein